MPPAARTKLSGLPQRAPHAAPNHPAAPPHRSLRGSRSQRLRRCPTPEPVVCGSLAGQLALLRLFRPLLLPSLRVLRQQKSQQFTVHLPRSDHLAALIDDEFRIPQQLERIRQLRLEQPLLIPENLELWGRLKLQWPHSFRQHCALQRRLGFQRHLALHQPLACQYDFALQRQLGFQQHGSLSHHSDP
jgi:hypothetical protein